MDPIGFALENFDGVGKWRIEDSGSAIDATGKLVTPGLIDLHCHVYPYGSAIGIPADELVQFQGTTTVV